MISDLPMIDYIKYEASSICFEKHLVNHSNLINGYVLTKAYFYIKGDYLLSNTFLQKEIDSELNHLFSVIVEQDLSKTLLFMPGHRPWWIAKVRILENREHS